MQKVYEPQKSHRYADKVQEARQGSQASSEEWDGYTVGAGVRLSYGYL